MQFDAAADLYGGVDLRGDARDRRAERGLVHPLGHAEVHRRWFGGAPEPREAGGRHQIPGEGGRRPVDSREREGLRPGRPADVHCGPERQALPGHLVLLHRHAARPQSGQAALGRHQVDDGGEPVRVRRTGERVGGLARYAQDRDDLADTRHVPQASEDAGRHRNAAPAGLLVGLPQPQVGVVPAVFGQQRRLGRREKHIDQRRQRDPDHQGRGHGRGALRAALRVLAAQLAGYAGHTRDRRTHQPRQPSGEGGAEQSHADQRGRTGGEQQGAVPTDHRDRHARDAGPERQQPRGRTDRSPPRPERSDVVQRRHGSQATRARRRPPCREHHRGATDQQRGHHGAEGHDDAGVRQVTRKASGVDERPQRRRNPDTQPQPYRRGDDPDDGRLQQDRAAHLARFGPDASPQPQLPGTLRDADRDRDVDDERPYQQGNAAGGQHDLPDEIHVRALPRPHAIGGIADHERAGHDADADGGHETRQQSTPPARPETPERQPDHRVAPSRRTRARTRSAVGASTSSTTRPSRRKTARSAYAAASGSWVTMTPVAEPVA